jgi:hypothetical protein
LIRLRNRFHWPPTSRDFGLARVIFYSLLTVVSIAFNWIASVKFVAVLSLVALIEGAVGAWRADVPNEEETG